MQLAIAATGFAGVIAELLLHEHWAEPWQVVPVVLCGAGLAAISAFAVSPGETTARLLEVAMLAAAAGAVIGMVQHTAGQPRLRARDLPRRPVCPSCSAVASRASRRCSRPAASPSAP